MLRTKWLALALWCPGFRPFQQVLLQRFSLCRIIQLLRARTSGFFVPEKGWTVYRREIVGLTAMYIVITFTLMSIFPVVVLLMCVNVNIFRRISILATTLPINPFTAWFQSSNLQPLQYTRCYTDIIRSSLVPDSVCLDIPNWFRGSSNGYVEYILFYQNTPCCLLGTGWDIKEIVYGPIHHIKK